MFVITVINFLFFSLEIATRLVVFTNVFIRKALIVDIHYPLSERGKVVNDALENLNIVLLWSGNLPVRCIQISTEFRAH